MRKYLKFIALCLLAGLILVWFGWNLNWAEVSGAIERADWRLIAAAVVVVLLTYLIRAFRWRTLLAPLAPDASLRETFAATTVGFSAIFLLGRAGEIVRPAFLPLRDRAVKPGAAFVTIAVERICDMSAVVVMFAANLLFLKLPGVDEAAFARVRQGALLLLVAAVLGLTSLVWYRRRSARLNAWLGAKMEHWPRALSRAGKVVVGLLDQLAQTLGVLVGARSLLVTIGWTAALWAAIAAANLLVLRAFGLQLGLSETVFVLGWALVGSVVPTPGAGAGTFHAATAYGLMAYLGVPETEAKAAVIVLHPVVFGPSLIFGVYYFLRSGLSLSRLRELIASEKEEAEAEKRAGAVRVEAQDEAGVGTRAANA